MNQGFKPIDSSENSLNSLRGSWVQVGGSPPNVQSNETQDQRTQEVLRNSPPFDSSTNSIEERYTRWLPTDSLILARKRLTKEDGSEHEVVTNSPVDIEQNVSLEEGKGSIEIDSEKDFKDLYFKINRDCSPANKDSKLEKVIRGLLQEKFLNCDIVAGKELPVEDRSYSVFRAILCYNELKKERFDLLYEALSQISNESKRTELGELIRGAESRYSLVDL